MKILRAGLGLVAMAILLMACGTATEVGNPTGDAPPTRTVSGVVDTTDLSVAIEPSLTTLSIVKGEESMPVTDYAVVAIAEGIDTASSNLDVEGRFRVTVRVGVEYTWELRLGLETVANFSFQQPSGGGRGPGLQIDAEGDDIDMGVVRYQDGGMHPEYEPEEVDEADGGGPATDGEGSGPGAGPGPA